MREFAKKNNTAVLSATEEGPDATPPNRKLQPKNTSVDRAQEFFLNPANRHREEPAAEQHIGAKILSSWRDRIFIFLPWCFERNSTSLPAHPQIGCLFNEAIETCVPCQRTSNSAAFASQKNQEGVGGRSAPLIK